MFGTAEHWHWGALSKPTPELIKRLTSSGTEWHASVACRCWTQYHLHRQLKQVGGIWGLVSLHLSVSLFLFQVLSLSLSLSPSVSLSLSFSHLATTCIILCPEPPPCRTHLPLKRPVHHHLCYLHVILCACMPLHLPQYRARQRYRTMPPAAALCSRATYQLALISAALTLGWRCDVAVSV
jgi:hypothetical protein